MKDPIVNVISVLLQRTLWFLLIGTLLSLILWSQMMKHLFHAHQLDQQWTLIQRAFMPEQYLTESILIVGCIMVGVLTTTILFLAIALWWRSRGDVHHHRGARVIDQSKNGG